MGKYVSLVRQYFRYLHSVYWYMRYPSHDNEFERNHDWYLLCYEWEVRIRGHKGICPDCNEPYEKGDHSSCIPF